MKILPHSIHPEFKFNGTDHNKESLISHADQMSGGNSLFEKEVGSFLQDWFSDKEYIEVRTSGSTGMPKRIKLKKQNMVHSALATGTYFKLSAKSTALLCLPGATIAAKMMLVRAMMLGWHLDAVTPTSSPLKEVTKSYDFCAMVPMQLRNSLDHLCKIRTLIIGGASLALDLVDAVREKAVSVYETFGMTETCSHIALKKIGDVSGNGNFEYGDYFETLPGISISEDQRGCLVIDAPQIADQRIITNDLVEISGLHKFKWLGRLDNVVNSGGIKLIPESIESKLARELSGRFVITSVPDKSLGEKLVLVLEGQKDIRAMKDKLKGFKGLGKYEMPRNIYTLESFPETHSGKPDRKQISRIILNTETRE